MCLGNLCPEGEFCVAGVSTGEGCPPGTFLNVTGGKEEADCLECPRGSYCQGYGNGNPTGPCADGYYCPPGQIDDQPSAFPCPVGEC